MPRVPVHLLAAAAAAAAACGGNHHATPAAAQPGVAITAENAPAVAGAAWQCVAEPLRVARIATSFFDVPPPAAPGAGRAVLAREIAGPDGGSALFTWDDRDGDARYGTGDTFTIAFADYGTEGRALTGTATFDDVVSDGTVPDGLTWFVTARLQLPGLRVTANGVDTTLSGTFTCHREQRATVRLLQLAPRADVPIGVRTLDAASGLARNDYVLDFSMGLFATGSFADPLLGGRFLFATAAPLTGIQVLPDPGSGSLVVTGAGGSTVTLQPVDFFNLDLLVDLDGDAVADATIPTTWAEL